MLLKIHDRVASLIKAGTTGVDQVADEYIENPGSELYQACVAIHKHPTYKTYVEASLLVSDDFEHISHILDIDAEIIATYAKIYYDVFDMDQIGKIGLVELADTDNERTIKLWAMSQGLDFLAWRLGKKVDISAVQGLTDLFSDCVYKSKEALFNSNATKSSQESTKWVKLSIDIAKLLKVWVTDSKAASKDIELALRKVIPEYKGIDSSQIKSGQLPLELPEAASSKMDPPSVADLIKEQSTNGDTE